MNELLSRRLFIKKIAKATPAAVYAVTHPNKTIDAITRPIKEIKPNPETLAQLEQIQLGSFTTQGQFELKAYYPNILQTDAFQQLAPSIEKTYTKAVIEIKEALNSRKIPSAENATLSVILQASTKKENNGDVVLTPTPAQSTNKEQTAMLVNGIGFGYFVNSKGEKAFYANEDILKQLKDSISGRPLENLLVTPHNDELILIDRHTSQVFGKGTIKDDQITWEPATWKNFLVQNNFMTENEYEDRKKKTDQATEYTTIVNNENNTFDPFAYGYRNRENHLFRSKLGTKMQEGSYQEDDIKNGWVRETEIINIGGNTILLEIPVNSPILDVVGNPYWQEESNKQQLAKLMQEEFPGLRGQTLRIVIANNDIFKETGGKKENMRGMHIMETDSATYTDPNGNFRIEIQTANTTVASISPNTDLLESHLNNTKLRERKIDPRSYYNSWTISSIIFGVLCERFPNKNRSTNTHPFDVMIALVGKLKLPSRISKGEWLFGLEYESTLSEDLSKMMNIDDLDSETLMTDSERVRGLLLSIVESL